MEEKTETMHQNKTVFEQLTERTEHLIEMLLDEGIRPDNADYLYKLVDIHKDIENEDYWKVKKEDIQMRYRNYGEAYSTHDRDAYGRRRRDSRGRYMARGYDKKYHGEEVIDDMYQNYQGYSEGREQYSRGNYGAKEDTMMSLEYMLECMVEFVEMLKQDAESPEEKQLIQKYTKQISEM